MSSTPRHTRVSLYRKVLWVGVGFAIVPLSLASYCAAGLLLPCLRGEGYISGQTEDKLQPLFTPMYDYMNSDLPGAATLGWLWDETAGWYFD